MFRTALYDWHVAHGGRMVEFGGWEMPVQYTGIVDEHLAVRKAAGLFDISHMGRLAFRGPQALDFLQHLVTCRVDNLAVDQIRYGLMCRADGGVLDDVLVYRLVDSYGLVVNAGNRAKILSWISDQQSEFEVEVRDHTTDAVMLALQGPQALSILQPLTTTDLSAIKYYHGCTADIDGVPVYLSRTGYTGEDGFEFVLEPATATSLADRLLSLGVKPCGLGARDTLRLEAAMPLYGHELAENIDPLTAGLEFAVKLDKSDFIGRSALQQIARQSPSSRRVGLQMTGKRIAREGSAVMHGETQIGTVTSGTFSPTLDRSIAMAYVSHNQALAGHRVEVDIRGKREAAIIVALPFYRRAM